MPTAEKLKRISANRRNAAGANIEVPVAAKEPSDELASPEKQEAILNPGIRELHERLANVTRYETIVYLVEQYLWQRIQSLTDTGQPLDRVIRLMADHPTAFSMDQWANEACLSVSQFERRFSRQVGISPKLFARTNRFYQAFQLKDQNPALDWLSVAVQTGYTDYQHLAKDFKQFAGATPNSLSLAQTQASERILGIG